MFLHRKVFYIGMAAATVCMLLMGSAYFTKPTPIFVAVYALFWLIGVACALLARNECAPTMFRSSSMPIIFSVFAWVSAVALYGAAFLDGGTSETGIVLHLIAGIVQVVCAWIMTAVAEANLDKPIPYNLTQKGHDEVGR